MPSRQDSFHFHILFSELHIFTTWWLQSNKRSNS